MVAWTERLFSFWHGHPKKNTVEITQDLNQTSQALLSLLSSAVVVVGKDGQVIRSSPSAYRLSIVNQDRIDNERVQEAVRQAWINNKVSRFSLVTQSVNDCSTQLTIHGIPINTDYNNDDVEDETATEIASSVSRPNWLKLTVGKIDSDLVLVLIDDESETKRFEHMRQAFIEHVSQQLLAPVDALKKSSQSLETLTSVRAEKGDEESLNTADIEHLAHEIKGYSSYLEHVLKDLLLFLRAQEQVEDAKTNVLNLSDQVQIVLDDVKDKAEEAKVVLNYRKEGDLYVNADPEQIRGAVKKLVENAIRYSPAGSSVTIVAVASQDGRYALVQVIDRGLGIPKEEQTHIFERFYRGSQQTAESKEGIGLGLAIAKHVALTHHGSLTVWSAPGQGSTFTLMLPLTDSSELSEGSTLE